MITLNSSSEQASNYASDYVLNHASDYAALSNRLGADYLRQRLYIQAESARYSAPLLHEGTLLKLLEWTLRLARVYERGVYNALALTIYENRVSLSHLPVAFEGVRVLHISDLHIDGVPGFGRHVADIVSGVDFDVCVLTGDFRYGSVSAIEQIEIELTALWPALQCDLGIYGVLGNHDGIEMLPMLERLGLHMLVNESVALRNNGAALWLVGVDDPHFYGLHDFAKAMAPVPEGAASIALVHSPEVTEEAAGWGNGLYLTGHTHGGQICLPGGWSPYINAHCPRRYTVGAWRHRHMVGYTSRGVGASGVFVRYHCPPEITLHHLVRGI